MTLNINVIHIPIPIVTGEPSFRYFPSSGFKMALLVHVAAGEEGGTDIHTLGRFILKVYDVGVAPNNHMV